MKTEEDIADSEPCLVIDDNEGGNSDGGAAVEDENSTDNPPDISTSHHVTQSLSSSTTNQFRHLDAIKRIITASSSPSAGSSNGLSSLHHTPAATLRSLESFLPTQQRMRPHVPIAAAPNTPPSVVASNMGMYLQTHHDVLQATLAANVSSYLA